MALRYVSSEVFSSRPDPESGEVVEAKLFVHVTEGDSDQTDAYALQVITADAYDDWYRTREVEGPADDDTFPLVIPQDLAVHGLLTYVSRRYLTSDHPEAVDEIRQFLFGPLEEPGEEEVPASAA